MLINSVTLKGFRNFSEERTYGFSTGRNLIYGRNGSGKTSILEAIYFSGFGKSFLNVQKKEILNYNSSGFYIRSLISGPKGLSTISCSYSGAYSHYKNDKKISIVDAVASFYPLFFSSSNYTTYIESLSITRRLFNRFIYGIDDLYTKAMILYGRALRQKKVLLKNNGSISQLKSWNRVMSEQMEIVIKKRKKFIENMNLKLKNNKRSRGLKVIYVPSVSNETEIIENNDIYDRLDNVMEKELGAERSLIGTHLDKISFEYRNKPLKYFSSGEKKFFLILIYLSFIEIFEDKRGEYPIFLIDDFDTAIDRENLDVLNDEYPKIQVISTSVNKWNNHENIIRIK